MAFRVRLLLGRIDTPDPSLEDILSYLARETTFTLEGDDGSLSGSFHVDRCGVTFYTQVEGVGDSDQFILTDRARGDEMVRSVTESGDACRYAAFCLVGHELVEQALRYFARTGERDPTPRWQSASDLLRSGHVEFE
jgi:hypothetical protein